MDTMPQVYRLLLFILCISLCQSPSLADEEEGEKSQGTDWWALIETQEALAEEREGLTPTESAELGPGDIPIFLRKNLLENLAAQLDSEFSSLAKRLQVDRDSFGEGLYNHWLASETIFEALEYVKLSHGWFWSDAQVKKALIAIKFVKGQVPPEWKSRSFSLDDRMNAWKSLYAAQGIKIDNKENLRQFCWNLARSPQWIEYIRKIHLLRINRDEQELESLKKSLELASNKLRAVRSTYSGPEPEKEFALLDSELKQLGNFVSLAKNRIQKARKDLDKYSSEKNRRYGADFIPSENAEFIQFLLDANEIKGQDHAKEKRDMLRKKIPSKYHGRGEWVVVLNWVEKLKKYRELERKIEYAIQRIPEISQQIPLAKAILEERQYKEKIKEIEDTRRQLGNFKENVLPAVNERMAQEAFWLQRLQRLQRMWRILPSAKSYRELKQRLEARVEIIRRVTVGLDGLENDTLTEEEKIRWAQEHGKAVTAYEEAMVIIARSEVGWNGRRIKTVLGALGGIAGSAIGYWLFWGNTLSWTGLKTWVEANAWWLFLSAFSAYSYVADKVQHAIAEAKAKHQKRQHSAELPAQIIAREEFFKRTRHFYQDSNRCSQILNKASLGNWK